jgi:hypothetical protein
MLGKTDQKEPIFQPLEITWAQLLKVQTLEKASGL